MFEIEKIDNLSKYVVAAGAHPSGMGGNFMRLKFDNGYGASVIQTPFSYGGDEGLFELAVLKFIGNEFGLDYTTEVTDDVIGHLEFCQLVLELNKIKALLPHDNRVIDTSCYEVTVE